MQRFLVVAKRSAAYRTLHDRFVGIRPPQPRERWLEGEHACYIFDLLIDSDDIDVTTAFALLAVDTKTEQVVTVRTFAIKPGRAEVAVEELAL